VAANWLGRLPFFGVVIGVAVAALGLVALGTYLRWGVWSLALLIVPGAFAAVYLTQYSQLPIAPPRPAPPAEPEDAEPFDDPVEEADRLASESPPPDEGDATSPAPPGDAG
jgi:hypothetical protein